MPLHSDAISVLWYWCTYGILLVRSVHIPLQKKTMKKNRLLIAIRSNKQFKKEVLLAFKRAAAGLPGKTPINRLYFESERTLFKALSPKRMELLKFLRQNAPSSIRKLSANLGRDYKNVYDDIKHLLGLDLVKKNRDDLYHVPWDDIVIELNLAA